ncbi:hypothetical protein A9Q99_04265 [Gammaproteobacteria bacterium 45_16_T64]|nr:hypothetical protein A9Q99_04265 [Gammaproteobacteria bacterium 45_16_T64]
MKTRFRKFQSALIFTCTVALSSAAFSANLLETYQLASKNDLDWAAKKAKFLGDRESVNQAFGGLLPNVYISAQYGQKEYEGLSTDSLQSQASQCQDGFDTLVVEANNGDDATPTTGAVTNAFSDCLGLFSGDLESSTQSGTQQSYSFRAIQPLFRADRWYKYKGAQSLEQSQEAELALAQQDLVLKAAEGYFGVLRAQEEYRIAKAERKSLKTQLTEIKNRYKLGLARDTDLFELQGTYDLTKAAEMVAEVALDNIKEDLALLTGQNEVMVTPLPENIPVDYPKPLERKDWEDFAKRNNYQIIAARFAVEAAARQIKEKRSGHSPSVDFALDHTDSRGDGGLAGDTKTTTVGIQMTLPIFSGGIVTSQEKQARYQHEEAKHRRNLATRNAIRETRQYHNKVISDVSTFEARKRAVKSNNSAYKAIKAGYETGLRSLSDVLSSQKKVYTARKELTTARFDYIVNTLKLKKASGILSPGDLEVLNGWLDTSNSNASFTAEKDELTLEEIDGIKLHSGETQLRSFDDEKKPKKPQHKSLFDAYKAWKGDE